MTTLPKPALEAATWAINDLFYDPEKDEDYPGDTRVADWLKDPVTLDELRSWIMGVVEAAFEAMPQIGKPVDWPYQQTFNAIAAATSIEGGGIGVSVLKFADAFGPLQVVPPSEVTDLVKAQIIVARRRALEEAEGVVAKLYFAGKINPFGSRNLHNCALSDAVSAIRSLAAAGEVNHG